MTSKLQLQKRQKDRSENMKRNTGKKKRDLVLITQYMILITRHQIIKLTGLKTVKHQMVIYLKILAVLMTRHQKVKPLGCKTAKHRIYLIIMVRGNMY